MASDKRQRGFLGSGWNYGLPTLGSDGFGIGLDADGRIAEADGEQLVHQSIWLILGTAIGERVSRPDFGCAIHDLVFASLDASTLGQIDHAVRQALELWEPRIELIGVRSEPSQSSEGAVTVEIRYLIRATNSRFNMVYPFYLTAAEPA
ncbi:baseplate protein [Lysobacter maris]|uniref:Baseplate protein n=1 Tax=Marilutibacter maris TaxID=1605891 RepID=A0A508BFK4_9GAMM|nr:GPW/gp25 family protein [Lysobacter maris]KAB8198678.1 baseplate protein [Lysobacter maris]